MVAAGKNNENYHDFGPVFADADKPLIHTFKVHNAYDKKMTINEVIESCGCIETNVGKEVINPGESANLTMIVKLIGGVSREAKDIFFTCSLKDDEAQLEFSGLHELITVEQSDDGRRPEKRFRARILTEEQGARLKLGSNSGLITL